MAEESLVELFRITPDTYGFRYHHHVAVFVVTGDGVLLVDPIGQTNTRTPFLLKEAIRAITEQPVKYLVYSHWGADHGMGGAAFTDTARIVGHRNTVAKILAQNDPASPPPDEVIDGPTTLELGGRRFDLYPANIGANDDYLIVHDPVGRLAVFVDLVQPRSIPLRTLHGHPDLVMERLRWLHDSLEFDVLLSGHASPSALLTKSDVIEQRRYLLDLSDAIAAASASGLDEASPEMASAVRASLQPKYGSWRRFDEFVEQNVTGMLGWRAGTIRERW